MPPTFLYLMGFFVWLLAAIAVLVLAGVLALFTRGRRRALQLVAGMVTTVPGIVAYQVVVAPVIVVVVLLGMLAARLVESPSPDHVTSNPVVIAISVTSLFVALALASIASLTGFYQGWRVGWSVASGSDFITAVRRDPLARLAGIVRSRVRGVGVRV